MTFRVYICKNLVESALFWCKYHIGPEIVINRSEIKSVIIRPEVFRMLIIMLNMRRKDLSCVYM